VKTVVSNLTIMTRQIVHTGRIPHKITEFYTRWFSICPKIPSKFQTSTIFKSSVKENKDPYETCRHVHDLS
jgi:hypothetical protein